MEAGARTPEELEDLLEDAFVTRDPQALGSLFDERAVLATANDGREARGGEEIAAVAAEMWRRRLTYLADPQRVLRSREVALVVAEGGISVVRRSADGAWRYAISLLEPLTINERNGR